MVSDGYVDSAPSELVVTAFSNNTPPVANAGPDQTVALGSRVQLDGSTSFDPDGSEVSYQWTLVTKPAGSNAALSVAASPTPSFDADVDGDFVFELVVNDGELSIEPDVLTITSSKNNLPPVAHAGLNQTVSVGQTVTLSGVQSYD